MSSIWPYILPLPVKLNEQARILLSAFGSEDAMEILRLMPLRGFVRQQEIVDTFKGRKSDKTVVKRLRELVRAGLLEESTGRVESKGKRVWVRRYRLTKLGAWISMLLSPPRLAEDEYVRELSVELFKLYAESVARFCVDYKVSPKLILKSFLKSYLSSLAASTRKSIEAAVFGSIAVDYEVPAEELPLRDETYFTLDTIVLPGGMAANVAAALAQMEVATALIAKVGADEAALIAMARLAELGVDLSSIVVSEEAETARTIVLVARDGCKQVVLPAREETSLSLSSPSEVSWERVEESKLVYVGEVYTEIARVIAGYARDRGKTVVYRPGLPMIKIRGRQALEIAKLADVFILNIESASSIEGWRSKLMQLVREGCGAAVVTLGSRGCLILREDRCIELLADSVTARDTTGAGDAFSAGLAIGLLGGCDVEDAARLGLELSARAVSEIGGRHKLA